MQEHNDSLRIQPEEVLALQESCEAYLVRIFEFEDANREAIALGSARNGPEAEAIYFVASPCL